MGDIKIDSKDIVNLCQERLCDAIPDGVSRKELLEAATNFMASVLLSCLTGYKISKSVDLEFHLKDFDCKLHFEPKNK